MYVMRNPLVGHQGIHQTSDVQLHPLGTIIQADDATFGAGEFVYLRGVGSTLLGSWVTYNRDDGSTARLVANAIGPCAVAMGAHVANTFGWYQIDGKAVGKSLAAVNDANVYASGTAGSTDDAVVAGDRVKGAKYASDNGTIVDAAGTSVANAAEFEIHRPYMDDGLAA